MKKTIDPIDELVLRSQDHRELRRFHEFHRAHPEVLHFLVSEIRLRLESFEAFSYHNLWEYGRWKLERPRREETFSMNDAFVVFYARAITILHPEFNGRSEFRKSDADDIFGTRVEPVTRGRSYSRRLEWADGTSLEDGWRPQTTFPRIASANRRRNIHRR